MPRYPIAIIGAGALGLVFCRRLSPHMRVALIARSEGRARELRAGVRVDEEALVPEVHAASDPPDADWILILVKASDTRAAAQIAARMSPRGVLSLQNGWVEELLREPLAGVLAAQGVTTEAALREGRDVRHTGAGAALQLATGVARAAARNRSSMLQDVEAGRETEAEFLTGALLQMASAHDVAAPTHQAFYRFLRKEHSAEQAMLAVESRGSQDGLGDVGRRREGS